VSLLEVLILGSYAFAAGGYVFTWLVYNKLDNHRRTELKRHLNDDCGDDCYFCED
jgi:hypothetical protein